MTVKPGFTPRKAEVEAIGALLESTDFEGPEDMAKAILAEAARILLERDLFVVYAKATPEVGWGPYFTEGKAKEAWLSEIGPTTAHGQGGGIIPVHPFPEAYVTGLETAHDLCACGHPRWRHTRATGTQEHPGKKPRSYCGTRKGGCHCGGGFTPAEKTA